MNDLSIKQSKAIYWASGIVSICGIIFEVLFGAAGSYLLGDGVKQYTLTISLFLTGMGIGASISEKVTKNLILSFVWIEYAIGILAGFSTFVLFGVTAFLSSGMDAFFLYFITLVVGGLTGVELPILIRKANEIGVTVQKSTAKVLFSDYAGGLIGGLLFVYLFRPQFGLVKTAFLVAIINVLVALWVLYYFRKEIRTFKRHFIAGIIIFVILVFGVLFGEKTAFLFEQKLYEDPIVYNEQTDYQQVILTKEQGDLRLFLDGQLQFSSEDEYRYHEVLVHPAMATAKSPKNVLVLGGGDGLALRELQKYDQIESMTLVDLDPKVTELGKTNHEITELNNHAFEDDRVEVVNQDAFQYLKKDQTFYDVILVDLPDPNNESLNKLYTLEFYQLLRNHLKPGGSMMVQATSPTFATEVYWSINQTIEAANLETDNLHVDIPSFGDWGFVLAKREAVNLEEVDINVDTKFLTNDVLAGLTTFGKDIDQQHITNNKGDTVSPEVNTLIRPSLIEKYEKAWRSY
ncbi:MULTISPECIES: polyamine aminopropyltransferase [Virgibacillus]|uniref:Polyamine aminopropyltransferase n=2 Tax=Virgibacillus TaxID=84406 RepID=A0A024QH19_9BACI|nr:MULTISPECIES: polyamine aminopropyltransferase [Virgibacillus]EQB37145.1 spermidine synthase [Virgibacillus sp. CM-4]MYL43493.1 polyamine aminopropyltransferase [Virgibacillus massiliensis]GGJ71907.1 polyamine aminopropyltransferase 1 [Virgibacillus kapii]CDQ41261.1 Spermidine synthase [Virgibacillus massiliensis]